MTTDDGVIGEIRDAFVLEVLSDPYRPREEILKVVAGRTGFAVDLVKAALVLPGSGGWVAEFSPTRLLPRLADVRTIDQLRGALSSGDGRTREAAVRNLVRHVAMSDESRELVLRLLSHPDAGTRLAAIPGSWRHQNGSPRDPILVRIRELATDDPEASVRAAALRRLGADADRDPRTVTTLLAAAVSESDRDVRVAAVHALRGNGRSYRRVLQVVAPSMLSNYQPLRLEAWKLVCELSDLEDVPALAGWLLMSVEVYPTIDAEQRKLLEDLSARLRPLTSELVRRLGSPSEMDRATVPRLLGHLLRPSDERSILRLHALTEDYSPFVRAAAHFALTLLRGRFTPDDFSASVQGVLWQA